MVAIYSFKVCTLRQVHCIFFQYFKRKLKSAHALQICMLKQGNTKYLVQVYWLIFSAKACYISEAELQGTKMSFGKKWPFQELCRGSLTK